ncbi:MAG: preQ(1) synthase, partial [Planctomycetota bacterium]|nr:preQ(1) synthase [Planctomycetota bacterium]
MEGGPVEVFDNPFPGRDYEIEISFPEFTSMCPKTGNPDFGEVRIVYVPDRLCLELKSLKLYFHGYRNRGIFYEDAVNRILDDLVASCCPREMTVTGAFNPRGGMRSMITVRYSGRSGSCLLYTS